ncbi:MAG TPA: ATP-binding cassette domain-containing protein [Rhodanobacteraceae bacterium]|jgi:phospholipid/cholesterol/gamma-HCH transport system ATP-binding protein|nr:ATP-binding cassette domain-containing protein [Rhodanobacteraceae bacterium]
MPVPAASGEVVIRVQGLHKQLGGRTIHRGIDLEVRRGELVSVIGASGAGKTLLLDQIIGLLRPDRGSIHVLGQTINHLEPWEARLLRRRWGVLFQQAALFSALNVYDNLAFPVRELRREGLEVDEALLREGIALKLRMVGLAPADAWKFPFELSGGMAKRAALARALMLEAELLFLDEPTSGLDPAAASEFDTLLGELHAELRFTALMITHDVYSVATLSDRVAVLADGRLATIGTLEDVAGCGQPFVADFFRSRHGENHLRTLPVYRSL